MSVEATLDALWEDFKDARKKPADLKRMRLCLKEFNLEYNLDRLPRYGPQKHMARRGVMIRSIERVEGQPTFNGTEAGTW